MLKELFMSNHPKSFFHYWTAKANIVRISLKIYHFLANFVSEKFTMADNSKQHRKLYLKCLFKTNSAAANKESKA